MSQKNSLQQRNAPVKAGHRGFTLIEIVIVLAILGILMMSFFPAFTLSQEVRLLDNTANQILMTMQTAKWKAADTKLNHRVRFSSSGSLWTYRVERESSPGTWTLVQGTTQTQISSSFEVTMNLPTSQDVIFQSTGFVSNYQSLKNSITLASPKLRTLSQPYQRIVRLFAGGSVQCSKT
jgi:prepilin-type N-terminal cleavage/methylation domain-containing protein